MSGAQGQGGATPSAAPTGDLAPMQMLQGYRSAPDRAAWMQQNQTPAQPVQPWQPQQRTYSQPDQGSGFMRGISTRIDSGPPNGRGNLFGTQSQSIGNK